MSGSSPGEDIDGVEMATADGHALPVVPAVPRSQARVILRVAATPADLFERTYQWFVQVLDYRLDRIGPAGRPATIKGC